VPIIRKLFVTKNGVEHEIKSQEELLLLLADLTPEERKQWEMNYRFTPITNRTGNPYYTGTQMDL
jgi:hypothetical protein